MTSLLPDLIHRAARADGAAVALRYRDQDLTYGHLAAAMDAAASGFLAGGLGRGERVGVYLEKRFETVIAMFGAAQAGGVFVPVNPLLKPRQVGHILRDCNVRILVTSGDRLAALADELADCSDLSLAVVVDGAAARGQLGREATTWSELVSIKRVGVPHRVIDTDMAAILYTSGSHRAAQGRRAVPSQCRRRRRERQPISGQCRRRPHPVRAAAQLRCRDEPAHDRVQCRCDRRVDELSAAAGRGQDRGARADHGH